MMVVRRELNYNKDTYYMVEVAGIWDLIFEREPRASGVPMKDYADVESTCCQGIILNLTRLLM